MFTSKFDAYCCSCRGRVSAGNGLTAKRGDKWLTLCPECFEGGAEFVPPPARRQAENDLERWAQIALEVLAEDDPDGATTRNNVGFNKVDGDIGKDLLRQANDKGLTPKQWGVVLKLANKYRRQVGTHPDMPKPVKKAKAEEFPAAPF